MPAVVIGREEKVTTTPQRDVQWKIEERWAIWTRNTGKTTHHEPSKNNASKYDYDQQHELFRVPRGSLQANH